MITHWDSEGWFIIYTIATAVMAITILITAIFAYRQLREIKKSRQSDAFMNLIRILQAEEIRQERGFLIQNLSKKKFVQWTDEEKAQAERVCHTYDTAGLMCLNKHIDSALVLASYHDSIVKCWEAAQPMISEHKKVRGDDVWFGFEKLYGMAKKYEDTQTIIKEA